MSDLSTTARDYIRRGWTVLPIHQGEKRPKGQSWEQRRIDAVEAMTAFSGAAGVGVHLGPSGLIDIDLDSDLAAMIAPKILHHTATFGRASRPVTHWIYRGELPYRKFVDPGGPDEEGKGECLLEIRSGEGKQTVFPGSTHPSGEAVEWTDQAEIVDAPEGLAEMVGKLAQVTWCLKHECTDDQMPPKVRSWTGDAPETSEATNPGQQMPEEVRVDQASQEMIDLIATECPEKGDRHQYRLLVAGTLRKSEFSESAAREILVEAMRKVDGSIEDAEAVIRDTYSGEREIAGPGALIATHEKGEEIVNAISDEAAPKLDELQSWTDRLYEQALGSNIEPLSDAEFLRELSSMSLKRDHRIHAIWARLKDSGWAHLKGLRDAVEDCVRQLKKSREPVDGDLAPCEHPEAEGMTLPAGYWLSEDRRLYSGEDLVTAGQLEILAKCPSSDGVQARIAFRSRASDRWQTTVIPYKYLIDSRHITTLAGHGVNCSSLESTQIVAYCRDFVSANEHLLDRPVATSTGWHDETGAFIWGRNVIDGPDDLRAEFAIDNQIEANYVGALRAGGDRSSSFAALKTAVEELPTAGLCIAAALAAAWTARLHRPCVGVHLGGVGGTGKTRTLKIAASVWGANGTRGGNSASGTIAGANSTIRALEIAAMARNDLPFFVSDVRPFQGLTEVLHSILNSDPRARATSSGGSTQGTNYRCGALITEGELNVKTLTNRQGFHRRVVETEPDAQMQTLWDLGEVCSEHFGHLGPAFVALGAPPEARFVHWREELAPLGAERALMAATIATVIEHAAPLLGADSAKWWNGALLRLAEDLEAAQTDGGNQAERSEGDLAEVMVELDPQIAQDRASTSYHDGTRPWVGFRDGRKTHVIGKVLSKALRDRGHDALTAVLRHLEKIGHIESHKTKIVTLGGRRVRCYTVIDHEETEE